MVDVFSKAKRSEVMSRIRGRGNRDTELAFVALLKTYRITGWRRHMAISLEPSSGRSSDAAARRRKSKVRPDFVFPARRLAVFIDGCFWHGCPKHSTQPRTNKAFWRSKLSSNKQRDKLVSRALRRRGWVVLRIWEHELNNPSSVFRRFRIQIEREARRNLPEPPRRRL